MMESEQFILHQKDWVPNNERLPVIVYRGAVKAEGKEAAEAFERMFADHGWPPQWRDTVYDYHHYHSTAHEALGVATGFGTLLLGGPGGREIEVRPAMRWFCRSARAIAGSRSATTSWSSAPTRRGRTGTSAARRRPTKRDSGCARSPFRRQTRSSGRTARFAKAGRRDGRLEARSR